MTLVSRDTGRVEIVAHLANADDLTHVQAFPSEAALHEHCRRTGLRIANIEERPVYELVPADATA